MPERRVALLLAFDRRARQASRKHRFEIARCFWHDATFQNGTPVEIKSAMVKHSDGQPGNFKVYREYHEKLRRANGWYCFVVYCPHGHRGLAIVDHLMVKAANLPLLRWHGGGDHRDTQQEKISIGAIF